MYEFNPDLEKARISSLYQNFLSLERILHEDSDELYKAVAKTLFSHADQYKRIKPRRRKKRALTEEACVFSLRVQRLSDYLEGGGSVTSLKPSLKEMSERVSAKERRDSALWQPLTKVLTPSSLKDYEQLITLGEEVFKGVTSYETGK